MGDSPELSQLCRAAYEDYRQGLLSGAAYDKIQALCSDLAHPHWTIIKKKAYDASAYTRRLLARLGYDFPDDHAIRCFFEQGLPRDAQTYGYLHWLILDHCIQHCKKSPQCQGCCFATECPTA